MTMPVIIDCPPEWAALWWRQRQTAITVFWLPSRLLLDSMTCSWQSGCCTSRLPFGVVLNKTAGNRIIHEFCRQVGIEIWMEIPYAEEIARDYAKVYCLSQATAGCGKNFSVVSGDRKESEAVKQIVFISGKGARGKVPGGISCFAGKRENDCRL